MTWGELKQATVLFADIVSSTEQIADLDAEQAMDRLGPALARMCASIEKFDGTVVRTLGDGVMAIFGAPRALEGHALLACEAALDMQRAFAPGDQGLRIRVGLHSGQVASDPQHADGKGGGAHGLTIHLASRVVGLADPGGICLTESCYALVRTLAEVQPMGQHALKGISGQSAIYALTGFRMASSDQHFQPASLTPFLGRDRESDLLKQALLVTERGQARVVGISGEPGAGKSRLCHEFVQWCRARRVPVFEVRAQPYGHATPLQPGLSLLRTFFFRILPADDAAVARGRIVGRMAELGPPAETDLALLYEFLGVAEAASTPSALSPKARHARLLSVVRELVKHDAATTSVILIEDLHWLDEASEEFVATLVEAAAGTRTMVVLNFRPSYRLPWGQFENFEKIDLGQLSARETEHLVRALIGPRTDLQDICELVAARSGGNPFFAEELVRSLVDRGYFLEGSDLRAGGLEAIERALPATVQAVIGARLDRLGEPEKTLLQMCAIIGKEIPLAVLEHMASPLAKVIEKGLDGLCHAELILPQPAVGGRRFTFRHPLIQEVAYSAQLKVRRGPLHGAVAVAMEEYYRDQLDEYAGLISYHYEAAGQLLDAASHAARAAQWVGSTNSALAIKHWHKVRALLQNQPRSTVTDSLRVRAGGQICVLGWREGLTLKEVQPYIDEATELAGEVDARLVQLLVMAEGRMLQASGGPADGYVERLRKAQSLMAPGADLGRAAMINAALSQAYAWAGLLEEALEANNSALRDIAEIDRFDREWIGFSIEQWVMGMRGRLLTRLGRLDEAEQCLGELLVMGRSSNDPVILQFAHFGYIDLAWCRRDAALAEEHYSHVAEIAARHENPYLRVFALSCRATVASIGGDFDTAARTYSEALKLVRSARVAMEFETELLASLAECQRRLGRFEQALDVAREAIDISRERSTRLPECRALVTLASAMLDVHGPASADEAQTLFAEAEHLVGLTGVTIYQDFLLQERSRLNSFGGRAGQASVIAAQSV
ncbi:adenylate/guanylate cyclase domain-containing protein [Polaromonas sp.]|uniref:ATP-binding protein n=1 Tax=Polaromonas sp. TaxID=1869339 RepID=UPI0024880346|nr:adenylate/guanylate cyclase domain-containing protein [Polaromonas sp.]MDI1338901.1 adenylate/guanylate cyclase domain-containing protein [Polaromonas sp.]